MRDDEDLEKPQRAIVFIDGNNLYHRLKDSGWKTWIDVGHLARKIVGNRLLVQIYYYNAPPPGGRPHTQKGNEYLAQVKKTPNLTFRQSWLQATQKADEYGPYHSHKEKGGDTALSTDLIALAAADEFDVAVIVSSDGDFAPTARIIRDDYGKCVEVIYFEGRKPFAMESCALMRCFRYAFIAQEDAEPSHDSHRHSRRDKPSRRRRPSR